MCFEDIRRHDQPLFLVMFNPFVSEEQVMGLTQIRYGEAVCLRTCTGKCVDVEGTKARWFLALLAGFLPKQLV